MRKSIKIFILAITVTLALTQTPEPEITEKILYNQNFKAKVGTLASFEIRAAIDFKRANESNLNFTSNWGRIEKNGPSPNFTLTDDYKTAKILLTDTNNGYLNLVGFNRRQRKCLVTLFYNQTTHVTIPFSGLSSSECNRVRVSRYGSTYMARLISYITDQGLFKWIPRTSPEDDYSEWKSAGSTNLYSDIIDQNEFHDVQYISCFNTNLDFFYIYQKSRGFESPHFYKNIAYFASNMGSGTTDSTSTLSIKYGYKNFFEMTNNITGLTEEGYQLESINWKSQTRFSDFNGYWLIFKNKQTDEYKSVYGYLDSDYNYKGRYFYRGRDFPRAQFSYDSKKFAGTADFVDIDGTYRYTYTFKPNGELKLCIPKVFYYQLIRQISDFEYNCQTKLIPSNAIGDDEYVDDVTIYSGNTAIVSVRRKGDIEIRNEKVFSFSNSLLNLDTLTNLYIANRENIFEIPRFMPADETPEIKIKVSKISVDQTLYSENIQLPEDPKFSVSNGNINVTHHFKLDFAEYFEKNFVEFNEFYPNVKESDKGKIISGQDSIRIKGDYIKSVDEELPDQFIYLTPFKMLQFSTKNQREEGDSEMVESPAIKAGVSSNLICETIGYYFYRGKENGFSYYTPKNSQIESKKYMLMKINPKPQRAKELKCISNEETTLYIGRGENKNIYSVVSFESNGEYLIREIFSQEDLFNIGRYSYNKFTKSYTLVFFNGKRGILDFRNLSPIYRFTDSTGGQFKVEGLETQFSYEVIYDDSEQIRGRKKEIILK